MSMKDVHVWWANVTASTIIGTIVHHWILGLIIGVVVASHVSIYTFLFRQESKIKTEL